MRSNTVVQSKNKCWKQFVDPKNDKDPLKKVNDPSSKTVAASKSKVGESSYLESGVHNLLKTLMRKCKKRKGKEHQHAYKRKKLISKGNKVISKGLALKTHFDNVGKYPNIVCKVESFCRYVSCFDERRRELLTAMGFDALLDLEMDYIPRQFCYWLLTRARADGTVVFGEGEILPLCANQMSLVLGIPMGAELVPMDVDSDDEEKVEKMRRVFDLYGVGKDISTVSLKFASAALCPLDSAGKPVPLENEDDEELFMITFLIVVLGKVVCTTTIGSNLVASLVPCLTIASEAYKCDWCTLTFNLVCDTANRFQRKFQKDGFRSGCRGSLLFVMIFYLDHLHRVLVKWDVYPRVKVWKTDEVKKALSEDRLMKNKYGRLSASNIPNGEEHPMVPREDQPVVTEDRGGKKNGTSDEMMTVSSSVDKKLISAVESVVANALGNGSNGKAINEKSRIPTNEEGNVHLNNGKTHTSWIVTDFEMNRKTILVSGNKDKDVEYSCSSEDSPVLGVGDCRTRSKTSVVAPMDKRLMTFLMLNLGKKDYEHLARKWGKSFLTIPLSQIRCVFIPVLELAAEDEHWWCLAFELKARQN
uniref:Uncharacterized protein n=1 Tax=Chenopodium quinoa TaxID=63459 RepID=A0A803N5Z7_CHEQI